MTQSDSLSSSDINHRRSSVTISPRPSPGVTSCLPRDKRKYLHIFLKDFDSCFLQAIQGQATFLGSSWFATYRLWKLSNFLQNYSFAAMSIIICGKISDPQHRDLSDIIQHLRELISIFNSLVSILTVIKSEMIWQINDVMSLSQLVDSDIIHQPLLENPEYVSPSSLLTTLVPGNIDVSITLTFSPITVKNLETSSCSLSDKFSKLSNDYSSFASKFIQLDVD